MVTYQAHMDFDSTQRRGRGRQKLQRKETLFNLSEGFVVHGQRLKIVGSVTSPSMVDGNLI